MTDSIFKSVDHGTETVVADSFDRMTFDEMKSSAIEMQKVEQEGSKTLSTYPGLMQDVFSSVYKYEPEIKEADKILASHRLNQTLIKKAVETAQYQELRTYTKADEVNSALATITIAQSLAETIKKELDQEAKDANELEQAEKDAQAAQDQADSMADIAGQMKAQKHSQTTEYKKKATAAKKVAKAANEKVVALTGKQEEQIKASCQKIRTVMRGAMDKAVSEIKETEEILESFGTEPGTMTLMPPEKRLAMAKKISQNPKLLKLAKLIGRFKRIAVSKQKTRLSVNREEVYDIEQGNDLSRVLPSELMLLVNPTTKLEFKRKFLAGELMQYKLRSKELVGKGSIIVATDSSSSMAGDKDDFAKAITLGLLEIARMQKRDFAAINFSSKTELISTEILKTEKNISEKVLQIATQFFGGGTSFQEPLQKALDIIEKNEFKKADVVFITDGQSALSKEFIVKFLEAKKRKEFKVFGIEIMGTSEIIKTFSDSVTTLTELGVEDAGSIFEGI